MQDHMSYWIWQLDYQKTQLPQIWPFILVRGHPASGSHGLPGVAVGAPYAPWSSSAVLLAPQSHSRACHALGFVVGPSEPHASWLFLDLWPEPNLPPGCASLLLSMFTRCLPRAAHHGREVCCIEECRTTSELVPSRGTWLLVSPRWLCWPFPAVHYPLAPDLLAACPGLWQKVCVAMEAWTKRDKNQAARVSKCVMHILVGHVVRVPVPHAPKPLDPIAVSCTLGGAPSRVTPSQYSPLLQLWPLWR